MATLTKAIRECFEPSKDTVTVRRLNSLIELRIGTPKRGQTRYVRLTPGKSRTLGCALIAFAEMIEPGERAVVPDDTFHKG